MKQIQFNKEVADESKSDLLFDKSFNNLSQVKLKPKNVLVINM